MDTSKPERIICRYSCSLGVAIAMMGAVSAVAEPFAPYGALPSREALPERSCLTVALDGTLCVNGKPRFLTATVFYHDKECGVKTSGYPNELAWLYEAFPAQPDMQRIGIDAIGFQAGCTWMQKVNPKGAPDFILNNAGLPGGRWYDHAFSGQMATYVDLTAAEWSHGGLKEEMNPQLPADAWTRGGNHWVPYSIHTDSGREIWRTMWREEVRRCSSLQPKPFCYELMNEPSVECPEESRNGTVAERVKAIKRVERDFASLIAEGAGIVASEQPGALATLQFCDMRAHGVNIYDVAKPLGVVCAPTGGGGIVEGHVLRALADGKPMIDGELYVGRSSASIRAALFREFQRGFNASYTFQWNRGLAEWARGGDAEQESRLAPKSAGWCFLNPYLVPPAELNGFRLARRDAIDLAPFFSRRDRGSPRRIAVLYSNPTERLGTARGSGRNALFDRVLVGLDYAHMNPDVIFEEQLVDDPSRIKRYRIVVAAGVNATYRKTVPFLGRWLDEGRTLICVDSDLERDEYGEPRPGGLSGDVRVLSAKGRSVEEIGKAIAKIAARCGVRPFCQTFDAESIEATEAVMGAERAWILSSRAFAPQKVRFRPALAGEVTVMLDNEIDAQGNAVAVRREIRPDKTGTFEFWMECDDSVRLVSGPREVVLGRYRTSDPDVRWRAAVNAKEFAFRKERAYTARRVKTGSSCLPPPPGAVALGEDVIKGVTTWCPAEQMEVVYSGHEIEMRQGERPSPWTGCNIELKRPVSLPVSSNGCRLAFDVARAPNRWGRLAPHSALQVSARLHFSSGLKNSVSGMPRLPVGGEEFRAADPDTNVWQTVFLDLDRKGKSDPAELSGLTLQYMYLKTDDPGGLRIRNLRLEPVN